MLLEKWSPFSQGLGLPRWLSGEDSVCQCRRLRRCGFSPLVGKIPWRGKWQATPVFLPGKIPWVEEPGGLQVDGVTKSRIWLNTNTLSHALSLLSGGEDSGEINTVVSFTIERMYGKGWQRMNLVLVTLESPFRGRVRRSLPNRVEGGRQEEKGNQSSRQSEGQVRKLWCQRTWSDQDFGRSSVRLKLRVRRRE